MASGSQDSLYYILMTLDFNLAQITRAGKSAPIGSAIEARLKIMVDKKNDPNSEEYIKARQEAEELLDIVNKYGFLGGEIRALYNQTFEEITNTR